MPKKSVRSGITPAILLGHMHGMEKRIQMELKQEIGSVRSDLVKVETRLNARLDRMENDITWIKVSAGNIDKRLDDLEVVQVPRLKKAVGMH